jgi:hypothetical protein
MTTLSNWLELFYLQAVLPEQNYIILQLTIKNSTSGNTVYKLPLAAWNEVVWYEAALQ